LDPEYVPGVRLLVVDAFTDRPFAGNPAAVVVVETGADEVWMQSVAAEMNLPETAFLRGGGCEWELRWFSPVVEVDLCGHATLASAHALWSTRMAPAGETLRFATRSGTLTASPAPEGAVALDFPAEPVQPVEAPPGLLDGLGARALFVGRNRLDTLVEVDGEATVRGLTPDLAVLATLPGRGFMVTAAAGSGTAADFVSRFFAPGIGIDEDPVTGSAHCALGPYWSERIGRRKVVGQQLSVRGGTVGVEVRDDRVTLTGRAVTIIEGDLVARNGG
jgi:predicted PhzF superfamily epimerase YddE/YHI9